MRPRGRVVIALGGNALLKRNERLEFEVQQRNVKRAAKVVARIAADYDVVVTHGNGPQVGLLALQSESYDRVRPYPLDVLGAESEGMIGYLLEQAIGNELPEREVATLLTRTLVEHDPHAEPTKPVGPVYTEGEARRLGSERGWSVAPDGQGYRRVVASPEPIEIVEQPTIELLVNAGVLVVCAGGGGIPVARQPSGALRGVEAVVDKDLVAAVLARRLNADMLLFLTDVDAVYQDWGTPSARQIAQASPEELRALTFAQGSMAPKVEGACRFVEATGGRAMIGRLHSAHELLAGATGTTIARRSELRRIS